MELRLQAIWYLIQREGNRAMKSLDIRIKRLCLAGIFLALGLLLPFFTGQIPRLGSLLLPMHLPVFLCGLLCGWQYGLAVGGLLPLLRFALFGMPKIFPTGIAMSFELAAYGLIAGALYAREKKLGMAALYRSLICAMVGGRVIWGSVQALLSGIAGAAFTWKMFLSGAIVTAIPGIVLQLALIPVIVTAFERAGIMRFEAQK